MLGGFQFKETMVGNFTLPGGDERPMSFTAHAVVRSWPQYLSDHKAEITGEVHMDGFATNAPLNGELTIAPLIGHVIKYEFEFTADDRNHYRFRGQKDVTIVHPIESMTTLPGAILDAQGAEVASALLKFPLDELPQFLGSFRPWA